MSEKYNKTGITSTLLQLLGIEDNTSQNLEVSKDDDKFEFLIQRIDDLSEQVQTLQGLTKLLAMNQTQLASDMYTIYSQVKDLSASDLEVSDSQSDSASTSFSPIGKPTRGRRGGSGGMIN